jgi:DNA mismatch endonuclease (patch repair protein)
MDKLSPEQRSKAMRAVKASNTTPEIRVRKVLHRKGFRFRLHRRDLPGTPDIVLPKHKTCIFVHGCFWHQHSGCKRATKPKTRQASWVAKFAANKLRDEEVALSLSELGWNVCTIWECQTRDTEQLEALIDSCLKKTS